MIRQARELVWPPSVGRTGNGRDEREKHMTTQNHLASRQYIAAYQAEIGADIRCTRRPNRLLSALRKSPNRGGTNMKMAVRSDQGLGLAT